MGAIGPGGGSVCRFLRLAAPRRLCDISYSVRFAVVCGVRAAARRVNVIPAVLLLRAALLLWLYSVRLIRFLSESRLTCHEGLRILLRTELQIILVQP